MIDYKIDFIIICIATAMSFSFNIYRVEFVSDVMCSYERSLL